jgi:hypothetical protein
VPSEPPEYDRGVAELPSGTVTYLFTDIEGSTVLLKQLGAGCRKVLALCIRPA